MISRIWKELTDRENTIFKCDNCKFVDCKNDKDTEKLSKGMKLRNKTAHEGQRPNGAKFIITKNAVGIVTDVPPTITGRFRIIWTLLGGERVPFTYDFIVDLGKVAYKCK